MGQEHSNLVDEDTPTVKLSERSLSAVAHYIQHAAPCRIVVMTGAGLSTAAGIPDFRSPNTGLYANLARLNLPYAEAVFDIKYFRQNPDPFYVLAKELYPGNYSPTVSHVFIALLAKKGLLRMLFTQNIDCLERRAGVPGDHIVEAHGSFATQRCIDCKKEFPDDLMKEHVFQGIIPRCEDKECGGLVKPDIVFFGEQLPEAFHANRFVPALADLILVMGTSLTVQPFASLPDAGRDDTPRVLFNMERVGSLGTRPDDVLELGDCDAGIRKLADALGWRDELEAEWRRVVGDKEAERQLKSIQEREAALQGEMEDLADRVGAGLNIDDDDDDASASGEQEAAGQDVSEVVSPEAVGDAPASPTTPTSSPPPKAASAAKADAEGDQQNSNTEGTKQPPSSENDQHTSEDKNGSASKLEGPVGESSAPVPPAAAEANPNATTDQHDVEDEANTLSREATSKSAL